MYRYKYTIKNTQKKKIKKIILLHITPHRLHVYNTSHFCIVPARLPFTMVVQSP